MKESLQERLHSIFIKLFSDPHTRRLRVVVDYIYTGDNMPADVTKELLISAREVIDHAHASGDQITEEMRSRLKDLERSLK